MHSSTEKALLQQHGSMAAANTPDVSRNANREGGELRPSTPLPVQVTLAENRNGVEEDPQLLKQQLELIQLCFAEHEFGIVDEEEKEDALSDSSSSPLCHHGRPLPSSSLDSHAVEDGLSRHQRSDGGLPSYDPLQFVNGKVQHGVPLSLLSKDLHAYARHLQEKIAQCVNSDVHIVFANVASRLVGMREELYLMDHPLAAAMQKLSSALEQLSEASQNIRDKAEMACTAEMERTFDAAYLRSIVVYETIAYYLDDVSETLGLCTDEASSRGTGDQRPAPPANVAFSVARGTLVSDSTLDVLEDVVLLLQELKEGVYRRLGSLPSREDEAAELTSYAAAAEKSVMGVLEAVLVHACQLVFSVTAANASQPASIALPPISEASSSVPNQLTGGFAGSLQLLGRIVEIYAQSGEREQFCTVLRNAMLRPQLEAVVSWKAATRARQSTEATVALLAEMKKVLSAVFLPLLPLLRDHYGTTLHPTATIVWPVLSETLMKKLPSLYEVGIPDSFHTKYTAAYELLASLEGACADLDELTALRQSPDVFLWNHKWNVDVYAALRVSEVDQALQLIPSPLDRLPVDTETGYKFRLCYTTQEQLLHLFSDSVFLLLCAPRFLRQAVTCLYRTLNRMREAIREGQVSAPAEGVVETSMTSASSTNAAAPVTHETLLAAIADADMLRAFITGQLRDRLLGLVAAEPDSQAEAPSPKTRASAITNSGLPERSTSEIISEILEFTASGVCDKFVQWTKSTLADRVTAACLIPLQNIKSVRSAYSHTGKSMPSSASWFVTPALLPLRKFVEEAHRSGYGAAALQEDVCQMLRVCVTEFVALSRETLITAKKTEESWEKLRRRKEVSLSSPAATGSPAYGSDGNSSTGAGAASAEQRVTMESATDRDKMTIQLWKDAEALRKAVQQSPLQVPPAAATEIFAPAFELLRRAEWIQGADIPEPPDIDT